MARFRLTVRTRKRAVASPYVTPSRIGIGPILLIGATALVVFVIARTLHSSGGTDTLSHQLPTALSEESAVTSGTSQGSDFKATTAPPGKDEDREVYVMNADGSNPMNLTGNPTWDRSPAWSPDGTKIAFVRTGILTTDIHVMNADGSGHERNITKNPRAADMSPTWSPDSTELAFVSNRRINGFYGQYVYVMDYDGTGQTNLIKDPDVNTRWPDWSPDGSRIVFSMSFRQSGDSDIYWISPDGRGLTQITHNQGLTRWPTWSPDGSKVAFASNRNGNYEIYVVNIDGTGQTNLTNSPASDTQPAWSPDGSRIAFVSDRDGNDEIYVMNVDGTGQTNLTKTLASDTEPAWSPDSSRIVFVSTRR